MAANEFANDKAAADQLGQAYNDLKTEIHKVIIGQDEVIERMLIALFCRGHVLLVGVPGLAKTLLISTIAQTLDLKFNRIQFTPDLMPSDILGTELLEIEEGTGKRFFKFVPGPVFAQVILADEINRTPPKTQSALLEAMQERKVTVAGQSHSLEEPFFVLATQNPIEQEGTYPLPEAQLDRFMFNLQVGYPTPEEEMAIVRATTDASKAEVSSKITAEQLLGYQQLVRRVPVTDHVLEYAVKLVGMTRPERANQFDDLKEFISWGAGPRASHSWCWVPKPTPCCMAATPPRRKMCAPLLFPPYATGLCPASTPKPKASPPATWCSAC